MQVRTSFIVSTILAKPNNSKSKAVRAAVMLPQLAYHTLADIRTHNASLKAFTVPVQVPHMHEIHTSSAKSRERALKGLLFQAA